MIFAFDRRRAEGCRYQEKGITKGFSAAQTYRCTDARPLPPLPKYKTTDVGLGRLSKKCMSTCLLPLRIE